VKKDSNRIYTLIMGGPRRERWDTKLLDLEHGSPQLEMGSTLEINFSQDEPYSKTPPGLK
jgi:hypothetical protein